ncbi:MAG TPA: hypothetical protein DFS52_18250 [Myxococcales bacterium]|nr:hypothetical protein [Myxococcales bacterium]
MRLQTGGRVTDLLLGHETRLSGGLSIIDWQRSPLAEVFFSCAEGEEYELEYGSDCLEMHRDGIAAGDKALVVDDLLATGGTAEAVGRLVAKQAGEVAEFAFVVELASLAGAARLGKERVFSLVQY